MSKHRIKTTSCERRGSCEECFNERCVLRVAASTYRNSHKQSEPQWKQDLVNFAYVNISK